MEIKEIITEIIVPIISGFVGGILGGTFVIKQKNQKQNNKKSIGIQVGDVHNGAK